MPAAVAAPVRQALWLLSGQGVPAALAARRLGISPRSARRLLRQARELGQPAPAAYRPGPGRRPRPAPLRSALGQWRREHPGWGADYLRLHLRRQFPDQGLPSARTIRRWLAADGLAPGAPGRPPAAGYRRAELPHQRWQLDAVEQEALADGRGVSWLHIVDEASGAFLHSRVFPPAVLGARPRRPGAAGAARGVRPLGAAG